MFLLLTFWVFVSFCVAIVSMFDVYDGVGVCLMGCRWVVLVVTGT